MAPMRAVVLVMFGSVLLAGCQSPEEQPPALFAHHSPQSTGVEFTNALAETADLNILTYPYYYNGGGVAVGDLNGDDLPDLYFTANEDDNRLYLNQGNFTFRDVTDAAGVAGTGDWTTGVTMADVNGDGRLDLYVSVVHGFRGLTGSNQLYINQGTDQNGVPQFDERAAEYGLDRQGYGTQAAFFDYDRDGDLDLYVLNHSVHEENTFGDAALRYERHPRAGDRLLENRDGTFVDVSEQAGIFGGALGYGLGVAISDLDVDGCPDVYVANDFHENDYLYYNDCDGTFTESIQSATGHNSLSSMGVDAADFNNDLRPDVVVLDMLPWREEILQTSVSGEGYKLYERKHRYGYHHQLIRNTLQLNRGRRRFSEIAPLAGVHATDWSWAPLFADLDNDGRKDLFVTNGIYRRPNDLDYLDFISIEDELPGGRSKRSDAPRAARGSQTEGREPNRPTPDPGMREAQDMMARQAMLGMPQVPIPNRTFQNTGDLTFADRTNAWGADREGFSTGAAYADLDRDGDLDLVTNNIGAPASLYENRADSLTDHHYLVVRLRGEGENTFGVGAKVVLVQADRQQLQEQVPTRGYQSSVEPQLHFGLGTSATVDSLTVIWPDGRYQTLRAVAADQTITLRQSEARGAYRYPDTEEETPLFEDVTDAVPLDYRHEENAFDDFAREPLLPHRLSTEGPALAVADVNGDGLDDLYAGGARRQPGRLLVQRSDGRFVATNEAVWSEDRAHEDVDAAFFDANGDGALDLYVVSGGTEIPGADPALRDRLYLNDGTGGFRRAENALPDGMLAVGACVAPADVDADGDLDLFVGSRAVAGRYGAPPESHLLENDGQGHFADVTDAWAPELRRVGMVTDATWTDTNSDGALDLVVVGTWMPVTVFAQQNGSLVERTAEAGFDRSNGWWESVTATDADGDGDDDLVIGNLGLNGRLTASPEHPARLYVHDFDDDGQPEPILTVYRDGGYYPSASRDELIEQIPALKERFPLYSDFAGRPIDQIFPPAQIEAATVQQAHTFATSYADNQDDGTFAVEALPMQAQLAPVHGLRAADVDGDARPDLLLGGNFYGVKPREGRYDASYGTLLQRRDRTWTAVEAPESNLYLRGPVRDLALLRRPDGTRLLPAARNDDTIQLLRMREASGSVAAQDR